MISIKIDGLKELNEILAELPKDMRYRVRRRAVTHAAMLVRDDARSRVPKTLKHPDARRKPGTLWNAIRVGWSKPGSSDVQDTVNVFVKRLSRGAITKFKKATGLSGRDNPDDPYYWTVWEFGNGVNNSNAFLRPAFDTKVTQAAHAMADALRTGIERAVARLRKRGAWPT